MNVHIKQTYRNGAGPIASGDRRLASRGHRRTGTGTGRRSHLAGALGHNLDLVDVQIIARTGRITPKTKMRITARGGHEHGVEPEILVVKVALVWVLVEAGVGRFRWGAAVFPPSEDLPATFGLARHVPGTVLDVEVLVVLKGADVPPELDLVDVVGGQIDTGGGQVEDGAGRHLVVVDETKGTSAEAIGPKTVGVEGDVGPAGGKVLPRPVVKVVDKDGVPAGFQRWFGGNAGLLLGGIGPDEVDVVTTAGATGAVVQDLEGRAQSGTGHLGTYVDGLLIRPDGTFVGGVPFRTFRVGTDETRGRRGVGPAWIVDVPPAGEVVRRQSRVGIGAAADLVQGRVVGEVIGFVRAAVQPARQLIGQPE